MKNENKIPAIQHEKTVMPRSAKSVSEAQKIITPLVNKVITNEIFGTTARLYPNSVKKMGSPVATSKSASPKLHAKAVANAIGNDGKRLVDNLYSVEAVEILEKEEVRRAPAANLVEEEQAPIADFYNKLFELVTATTNNIIDSNENVNSF